ncbi:MAG: hypothetical protein AMXMBFR61_20170 [Fimbriimonadales bacterium]
MARKGTLLVGTSGWSYVHWARGVFYPKGLKQAGWLAYFAGRFRTAEVNMSFYRLPPETMVDRWRDAVPDGFVFAVKMWRRVTHERRLKGAEREIADFWRSASRLGNTLGPILVQLPPRLPVDFDVIDGTLATLREVTGGAARVAVEFRNEAWLSAETKALLDRHGAALCVQDHGLCTNTEPNDAPFVYVRRHGPSGRYAGCYSEKQLSEDASRIRGWLDEGRDVYVYFNNDIEGHAVRNALRLLELAGTGPPSHGG